MKPRQAFVGRPHTDLKNRHDGEDLWVLASGPSMRFVDPSFFSNKITIGVNRIGKLFPCHYVVSKDPAGLPEILEHLGEASLIVSKHERGNPREPKAKVFHEHHFFTHPSKVNEGPLLECVGTDDIVVSWSTVTSAIHLAAYMGARNIILCGHDCGTLDGHTNVDYYDEDGLAPMSQFSAEGYAEWVSTRIEAHTLALKARIREVYGTNIHSLNPFINFNNEGHVYKKVQSAAARSGTARPSDHRLRLAHFAAPAPANAGDLLLCDSVRVLFDKIWGNQEWNVLEASGYTEMSTIQEMNRERDGVLVGGGGLFVRDTNENPHSGWQWQCPIEHLEAIEQPLALFGVGYNRFRNQADFDPIFTEHINTVAMKACFIGLKNRGSVRAIRGYLRQNAEKVVFQPCTTTLARELYDLEEAGAWAKSDRTLGVTLAFDRADLRFQGAVAQFLDRLSVVLEWAAENDWDVKVVNQFDSDMTHPWLQAAAKKYGVVDTCNKSPEEAVRLYNGIALMLGMRGHSQLIPFGVGNAFISLISHDELKFFLEDIDRPQWGVEVTDQDLAKKLIGKIQDLDADRLSVQQGIDQTRAQFWQITRHNLDALKSTFVRSNSEVQQELSALKKDRWYRFGQLTIEEKLREAATRLRRRFSP